MKDTHKAVLNFTYFTANFPPTFIDECWKGESWLIEHIKTKFKPAQGSGFMSKGDFMNWFMELDEKNKIKLLNWIDENYLAFQNYKQNED